MIDDKGLILCPVCGRKTKVKVIRKTELKNFPLFCPKCKNQSMIDLHKGQIIVQKGGVEYGGKTKR
jgi:endogenous inhibitor of DNA gyrase (YacG/DUF329 family)